MDWQIINAVGFTVIIVGLIIWGLVRTASKKCPYCGDGQKPMILDEDGVKSSISGKPGRWAHASLDGHWGCEKSPSPDPDPPPYKFASELIAEGKATICEDPECENGVVIDGICTWCGKEYPIPEVNENQIKIEGVLSP